MDPRSSSSSPVARGWLALVAATSLGLGSFGCIHAEVASDEVDDQDDELRLVVQSYPAGSLQGSAPRAGARPLGSTQRAITREELRQGVSVRLVQLDGGGPSDGELVAWVERGAPDLEFDARAARPTKGAVVGIGAANSGPSRLILRREA